MTTQNEWISVDERLPKRHSQVIVAIEFKAYKSHEIIRCSSFAVYDGGFVRMHREDEHQQFEDGFEYIGAKVTHWMPAPDVPATS